MSEFTPRFEALSQAAETGEPKWAKWIRLQALRRALWLQHVWAGQSEPGYSPHMEVMRLLSDPLRATQEEAGFHASSDTSEQLSAAIETTRLELDFEVPWAAVCQLFRLSQAEREFLALLASVEAYPELRRVFGYLNDEAGPIDPSPWSAARLFNWAPGFRFGPESQIHRWQLAHSQKGAAEPWSAACAWVIDPSVARFLAGQNEVDPEIRHAVQGCRSEYRAGWPTLYPQPLKDALEFIETVRRQRASRYEIELAAPPGAGKTTLAAQIAAALERELLPVECSRLVPFDADVGRMASAIARACRTAALKRAIPYWGNIDALPPLARSTLRDFGGLHILGSEAPSIHPAEAGVIRRTFRVPPLSHQDRAALWERMVDAPAPAPVREWSLRPSDVVAAALVASAGPEAVVEVCRTRIHSDPGELFTVLPCPFSWDDFVLSPGTEAHLREFESQAKLRHEVFEDWGFDRHVPFGQGISALFAGPSGVGKTMAAQVLGRSLDLQVFKVDLASVLNKYVGETEKRIRSVFERCQRSNVMLFFDEADALFGHRVQAKDAQDRFANIEIDYLLQQMEQYSGVAVLATNRKAELDRSFLRRLNFVVDFLPPSPAERLRLWQLALLPKSPSGEELLGEIDWGLLANKLNLTGADIKNAAIGAAFLARSQGTRIGMPQVLAAVRRELTKQGVVLRPTDWEMQEWRT